MLGHGLQQGGLHLGRRRLISSASTRWLNRGRVRNTKLASWGWKTSLPVGIGEEQIRGELDTDKRLSTGTGQRLTARVLQQDQGPLDQHMSLHTAGRSAALDEGPCPRIWLPRWSPSALNSAAAMQINPLFYEKLIFYTQLAHKGEGGWQDGDNLVSISRMKVVIGLLR